MCPVFELVLFFIEILQFAFVLLLVDILGESKFFIYVVFVVVNIELLVLIFTVVPELLAGEVLLLLVVWV